MIFWAEIVQNETGQEGGRVDPAGPVADHAKGSGGDWAGPKAEEQLFPFFTRDLISSLWCYSWVKKTNIDRSSTVWVNSPIVVMS